MRSLDVDAVLVSVGKDMPYLSGYTAMPLERVTMLVITQERPAHLVIPRLEAMRVTPHPDVFDIVPWDETDDPIAVIAHLCGAAKVLAVGDQMWARFLVELHQQMPHIELRRAVDLVGDLRIVKDDAEIAALRAAGAAVDRIAARLQTGAIELIGRTEAQVSAELAALVIAEGHQKVNFAIVAAGENAASPHHHPGERVIGKNEIVLCDFGGTMDGYCSDITRCVYTGPVPGEVAEAYDVLHEAQQAAFDAATVGTPCQEVDRVARRIISDAGFGEYFVHRTGHGIGLEEHEDPYMVEGNLTALAAGHAFSIEPGIYVPDKWGMRLEDIVVATADGPQRMNLVDRALHEV